MAGILLPIVVRSAVEATGDLPGVAIGLGVVAGCGERVVVVVVVGGRSSVATVGVSTFGYNKQDMVRSCDSIAKILKVQILDISCVTSMFSVHLTYFECVINLTYLVCGYVIRQYCTDDYTTQVSIFSSNFLGSIMILDFLPPS